MSKSETKSTNGDASAHVDTQTIVVQGVAFTAPAPFHEGHVMSAAEANVLNQTYGENLRNNFASQVKEARKALGLEDKAELTDGETLAKLATAFAEYAANYTFSGKRQAKVVADPVEREAVRIARSIIVEHLAAHKITAKQLPEGRMDSLVAELLGKRPDIKHEAARRINATKEAGALVLDDLIAKATAGAAETQAAAE